MSATIGVGTVPRARGRSITRRRARRLGLWAAVTLIVGWSVFPFLWQVNASFQPDRQLARPTPTWLPIPGTFDHYRNVFVVKNFGTYIGNSAIAAVSSTIIALVLAALCAYALARLPVPGKGVVLGIILGMSMFPQISIVTPLFMILRKLQLLDTYRGLSGVYIGLALPLMVWVMWGHFRSIPREIDEAAKIDGAGPIRTLRSVILPMALPGVVTAGLLGFIASWNEFLLALSFTSTPAHQTIPVGIANFTNLYFIPWGDIAAASVVVTIPLVLMVLFFQRRIVAGLTAGAVKE
jgi:ABC-type glycerol-3-phosphate transport system permease component